MVENTGVRYAQVAGRPVVAIDGLMTPDEAARLFERLSEAPFTRNEVARPETQAFRHWAWNLEVVECMRMSLYTQAVRTIAGYFPERGPQRLYRAYCNLSTYGDMLFTHTDAHPNAEGLTALWYIAPRWDTEWGGETLFFDDAGDAQFVVSPRPGRLVIFDGCICHAGRPPSRICTMPRLTFALKFVPSS